MASLSPVNSTTAHPAHGYTTPMLPAPCTWRHPVQRRQEYARLSATGAQGASTDVAIIGGGIVGLCIADQLLQEAGPALSVTLVERREPCAGATGAGQGYIWLAHRNRASPAWPLAQRSRQLWQQGLAACLAPGRTLGQAVHWQENGSLLLAQCAEEADSLQERAEGLTGAGVAARYLTSAQARHAVAGLALAEEGGALLVAQDAQLDGRRAAAALLERCRAAGEPRFRALLEEEAVGLHLDPASRRVAALTTSRRTLTVRHSVVLAAGTWTGQFLHRALGDARWDTLLAPRRGHLLDLAPPRGLAPLPLGLMEAGYTKHYASQEDGSAECVDITFTATSAASGRLLLGSSRESSGWDCTPSATISRAIFERAVSYLPALAEARLDEALVRVGLRPHAAGGLPLVGPCPGLAGVLVAAGHEGSGLTLAPATAELVAAHLFGRPVPAWAEELLPCHRL